MLLFYLNSSFGSWNMKISGGSYKVENGIIMTSWNGLLRLPILSFGKT